MGKAQYFTDSFLDDMRMQMDPLADHAFSVIKEAANASYLRTIIASVHYNHEKWPEDLPPEAIQYFKQSARIPEFANLSKMKKGAAVFVKHADDILSMLGFASLPYCYAASDGARVLDASPRLINEPSKRLLETARFVMDVMDPLAFTPQGRGIKSIQKVRLMHAAVRYYILNSGHWQADKWGVPVNQEDMAGTQLAFWYIPIRSFRKIGISLSREETDDFRHLWSVVGRMLGVEERLLPDSAKESYQLLTIISRRTIKASDHGKALTRSLIDHFKDTPVKGPFEKITEPYMRYLLGDEVADAIGLKKEKFTKVFLKPLAGLRGVQNLMGSGNKFYRMRNLLGSQIRKKIGIQHHQYAMPQGLGQKPN
ncbi:oxygenase MpaB family protein [Roseivirga sp. BDSF3-8]|uniref:oxygenase MpaB family protein n=1 Tax=Roseivirga sp. BDSF3-8 TaxID=3241598 RepID=UPI003532096D